MISRKVIGELVGLVSVASIIWIMPLVFRPFERGFYCNDESISYPWRSSSTVESEVMYSVGISLNIAIISAGEYTRLQNLPKSYSIPNWLKPAYTKIAVFLLGAAVNEISTELTKYQIGRLRPFFLTLCVPNVDCSLAKNQHVYIRNFNCTGESATTEHLRDARKSFPSGHSSFSAYAAIYLMLYLKLRLRYKGEKFLWHILQYVGVMLGWYTAMSRVSDYKHHWSDVLAGLMVGINVACFMALFVADFFDEEGKVDEKEKNSRNIALAQQNERLSG